MKRRDFLQKSSLTAAGAIVLAGQSLPTTAGNLKAFHQMQETPLEQGLPLRFRQVHLDFHTSGHNVAACRCSCPSEQFYLCITINS